MSTCNIGFYRELTKSSFDLRSCLAYRYIGTMQTGFFEIQIFALASAEILLFREKKTLKVQENIIYFTIFESFISS